jgi:plasmid maintenance system killer protein
MLIEDLNAFATLVFRDLGVDQSTTFSIHHNEGWCLDVHKESATHSDRTARVGGGDEV